VGNPAPLTNGSGIAAAFWTLGAPGPNELTASLTGLPDVVFQATGTVGAPDTVVIVAGNAQTDTAGLPLAQPLEVEVRDSVGNPVSGIAVNWNTFNGSISPPANSTDLSGRAQATWTLGTNAVNQSATAAVYRPGAPDGQRHPEREPVGAGAGGRHGGDAVGGQPGGARPRYHRGLHPGDRHHHDDPRLRALVRLDRRPRQCLRLHRGCHAHSRNGAGVEHADHAQRAVRRDGVAAAADLVARRPPWAAWR
jgi:hypothetical protein